MPFTPATRTLSIATTTMNTYNQMANINKVSSLWDMRIPTQLSLFIMIMWCNIESLSNPPNITLSNSNPNTCDLKPFPLVYGGTAGHMYITSF